MAVRRLDCLAGALTNSTAIGTATALTSALGADHVVTERLANNVATRIRADLLSPDTPHGVVSRRLARD